MDVHSLSNELQANDLPPSASMRTESRLKLLVETGLLLAREKNLDTIARMALGVGASLSGAAFGALFYSANESGSDTFELCQIYGFDRGAFAAASLPRSAMPPSEDQTGRVRSVVCFPDGAKDALFGRDPLSSAFLSLLDARQDPLIRSYLAVPIPGRGRHSLGAMLLGHPDANVFPEELESPIGILASQTAVALGNSYLASSLQAHIGLSDSARQLQLLTARRLRQALEAAALGTFTWDRASDLLDLDERAAELFHAAPNVPISRSLLRERLVIPEDRELTAQHLRESLESGGTYSAEYRIAAPDGSVSWLSTSGLATGSADEVTGMTGIIQDITVRKTQEAALLQSEKLAATGRLAASIAHEINNPLEAITNLIYLVKTDPELPPHLAHMMQTADSELTRVGQIAQHTLGFYRDTSHPAEIDLSGLLSAVINLYSGKLGHKRLQCTLDLEPDLCLFGFAGEMRQIFSNLLVNAIDATSSGTIHLRARSRTLAGNPGVVVLLADPGGGIPHHARRRLFSPFFTTKEATGTGLGLWVTRGMVEKHGGRIHFRSRTEHPTGTVFRVHLPQAFPSAAGMYSAPTATPIQ